MIEWCEQLQQIVAAAKDFVKRQHEADTPFFVWLNTTHMHLRTHTKPESIGQAGRWQSPYHDTMIDHDKNVGEMLKSNKPEIARLLGTDGNLGEQLGLTKDWVVRIVKAVGNYGESFDRNVGAGSKLRISRGLNKLWNQGGIQYAPPIR